MTEPGTRMLAMTVELDVARVAPVVLIVSGAALLLWAIWRRPRQGWSEPKARARQDAQRVQSVVRDAEELAGLLAGQMDRQAERMERLIREADAKIRELEKHGARPGAMIEDKDRIDPLNQQVYELADEGMPPVEIARHLSQHTGKVELILALRQR